MRKLVPDREPRETNSPENEEPEGPEEDMEEYPKA
jgi:hypothetical protein